MDNYKFYIEEKMLDDYLEPIRFSKAFCIRFNEVMELTKGKTMTRNEILEEEVKFLRKKMENLKDENESLLRIIDKQNQLLTKMIEKGEGNE